MRRGAGAVEQMAAGGEVKDQAMSPVGDFIAMVSAFAGFIFALALPWYSIASLEKKGVDTVVGVICFAAAVGAFAFAIVVLIGRFINPKFKLSRSPGWVYGLVAAIIFMACIVGLVVTPKIGSVESSISYGIVLTLLAAAGLSVASLLKF